MKQSRVGAIHELPLQPGNSTYAFLSPIFSLFSNLCITHAKEGVRVEMFSPQGMVKEVRQVKARFSEQLAPFGEPRLAEPFDINCPEKG